MLIVVGTVVGVVLLAAACGACPINLNPKSLTLNRRPDTFNLEPCTLHPKP
jgi:hypothetical protein